MKILITGNRGYIGPIVTKLAHAMGHYVIGLDVGFFNEGLRGEAHDILPDRQITRDIRDLEAKDLQGAEAIIHLAGLSNDPMGALNPKLTQDINLKATLRLGNIAKEIGIQRFVFASSCSIYGAAGTSEMLDESAPFHPVSAYAISKVKSEEGLSSLADGNFSPVFMRNATAFGVSPCMRFDLVLNNLVGWAYATDSIKVMSDGTPWRPLVHIEDISRAAIAAATAPREIVHNRPFNIGRSDANYRVSDIAQSVICAFPNAKIEITGQSGGDPRSYCVDFRRALQELPGFAPQWKLEDGVEEIARWLKGNGLRNREFESRLFVRLKQLKYLLEQHQLNENLRYVSGPQ